MIQVTKYPNNPSSWKIKEVEEDLPTKKSPYTNQSGELSETWASKFKDQKKW